MARTADKVTQQSVRKMLDVANTCYERRNKNLRRADVMKDDDPEFAEELRVNAAKWNESYLSISAKIIRRLTDGMTESHTTFNKFVESVIPSLPQSEK